MTVHIKAATDSSGSEEVLNETLDLLMNYCGVARAILNDIAEQERTSRKKSKRDRVISRWEIYLGVMLLKQAEAIQTLAPSRNVRAGAILVRSMYEYQQKAEYFLKHRRAAFEQYGSIGARQYAELSKLTHPDPSIAPRLAAAYLEWKRTSGSRDEHSGNVGVVSIHLQNAKKSAIKTAKDGSQYTEEFQTTYSVPSLYVHGEPLLMPEVFPMLSDDTDWDFREDSTYFDFLSIVAQAYIHVLRFCVKTTKFYDLDYGRIRALNQQAQRVINAQAILRGYNKRLI